MFEQKIDINSQNVYIPGQFWGPVTSLLALILTTTPEEKTMGSRTLLLLCLALALKEATSAGLKVSHITKTAFRDHLPKLLEVSMVDKLS